MSDNNKHTYILTVEAELADDEIINHRCNGSLAAKVSIKHTGKHNHLITDNGKTQSVADWSRETGIGYSTLMSRIKSGKTGDEIINFNRRDAQRSKRDVEVTIDGETMYLSEWAFEYGIGRDTLYKRYAKGIRGKRLIKTCKVRVCGEEKQLCVRCGNFWGGCNWSRNFKPVEGWTAKPTIICNKGRRPIQSYEITACPEFIPDGRERGDT